MSKLGVPNENLGGDICLFVFLLSFDFNIFFKYTALIYLLLKIRTSQNLCSLPHFLKKKENVKLRQKRVHFFGFNKKRYFIPGTRP